MFAAERPSISFGLGCRGPLQGPATQTEDVPEEEIAKRQAAWLEKMADGSCSPPE